MKKDSVKEVTYMAVPQRRTSKTRRDKRRTHFKLEVPGMVKCSQCGELKLSHHVCKVCGSYKGREIISQ
jgi:large subunit ribosomal protein L32